MTAIYDSPVGPLALRATTRGLAAISFDPGAPRGGDPAILRAATAQLDEYFAGERRAFDLPLDLTGTESQQHVWAQLREIPYGETISYGELAARVDRADVVRAVAATVGRTPTPIVVPCHRVIGADGSLTGYGGGLHRKRTLLDLEAGRYALWPEAMSVTPGMSNPSAVS
jgi:methylated-DNA-[protein]-cysteine S-methyltransferase